MPTETDGPFPYDFTVDPTDDSLFGKVLRLVGYGKRVLELGCATGYLSRALREHQCTVVAIEIDRRAAARAEPHCERVIVGDLETLDFSTALGEDRFDVVLATDVLEHLTNPTACLRAVKECLSDRGYVVASIPNVAHGSVRLALLDGRFEYTERFLLDRTHLRFFTRDSIYELFDEAGLAIAGVKRHDEPFDGVEIPCAPGQVPSELYERLVNDPDARTYQYVIQAYPVTPKTPRELLARFRALLRDIEAQRRARSTAHADGSEDALEVIPRHEIRALRAQLHDKMVDLDALQRFVEEHTAESSCYAQSLREHLEDKVRELRSMHPLLESQSHEISALRTEFEARERGAVAGPPG